MDSADQVSYWVRLGALIFIVVLQIAVVLVQVRRKKSIGWRRWMGAVVPVLTAAVTMVLTGVRVGLVWVGGLMVVCAVLGWMMGNRAKVTREAEQVTVRRGWLGPVLMALGMVLMAVTLLFGTTYLLAWSFLLFAGAAALASGGAVGEILAERRAAAAPALDAGAPAV